MANYVEDLRDNIMNVVRREKRVLLRSHAGSGKTTFINNLALQQKVCIIAPYNSVIGVYHDIDVYTNTRWDYDNATDQLTGESVVMNFDNAVRKWGAIEKLFDTIIVDESHTLFWDRTFRTAAIDLMMLLRGFEGTLICVTATPLGEVEALNLHVIDDRHYEWMGDLNKLNIKFTVVNTPNADTFARNMMNMADRYDYVYYFDDKNAVQEYNLALLKDSACTLFKANMLDYNDICRKSLKDEMLQTKYNFGTRCVLAGLNFRNNGKVLCIMRHRNGEQVYSDFQQAASRFRNAQVDCIVVHSADKEKKIKEDADLHRSARRSARHNVAEQVAPYVEGSTVYGLTHSITDYYGYNDAMKEIDDYMITNSMINRVIDELSQTHNVNIHTVKHCDCTRIDNVKSAISKRFYADYLNDVSPAEMTAKCRDIYEEWMTEDWLYHVQKLEHRMGRTAVRKVVEAAQGTKLSYTGMIERVNATIRWNGITEEEVEKIEQNIKRNAQLYINKIKASVEGARYTDKQLKMAYETYVSAQKTLIRGAKIALEYFPNGIENLDCQEVAQIIETSFDNDALFTSGESLADKKRKAQTKGFVVYGVEGVEDGTYFESVRDMESKGLTRYKVGTNKVEITTTIEDAKQIAVRLAQELRQSAENLQNLEENTPEKALQKVVDLWEEVMKEDDISANFDRRTIYNKKEPK